jgi:hypothetical protein
MTVTVVVFIVGYPVMMPAAGMASNRIIIGNMANSIVVGADALPGLKITFRGNTPEPVFR